MKTLFTTATKATNVTKQVDGWQATTELEIGHGLILFLKTNRPMRSSAYLRSYAYVGHLDVGLVRYTLGVDFRVTLWERALARLTEGAVRAQHDDLLKQIDHLTKHVLCFYGHDLADVATPQTVEACDVPY